MFQHAYRSMARRLFALGIVIAAAALGAVVAPGTAHADWIRLTPPISTPWTGQVSPTNALPEYPRPQLTRTDWLNLNGVWQFAGAANLTSPPIGQNLAESVLVPYPIESSLSGIRRHENNMWYRRTFTVPSGWSGRRVQLNFGAVTWRATVWVNGQQIGTHSGGFDAFSFDITNALNGGTNEIIVGVFSPVSAGIPIGKQRLNPGGIFYTAASGIWQTVWLEPTNSARITRLDTTPDLAAGVLDLVVQGAGISGQAVSAQVLSGGTVVGSATGAVGAHLRIPVPNARLWSPDDPFLYDLRVSLTGTGGGDLVTGYFGMRSVGKAVVNGALRPTLNGKFVFGIGTLDQGYWPDGVYTAPTDEALRFDLEQQKAMGFNTVRKHIKVEPARWFYHADRLGLMVWQDMPSLDAGNNNPPAADRTNFESELTRIVNQLKGITSITQWIPFNEGWGEYDAGRIADLVKALDPTRLVNHNSGANCCASDPDPGNGDVIDDHIYVGPGNPRRPSATRVAVLGEFGGLGLRTPGHEWPGTGFAYEMAPNAATLNARYEQVTAQLRTLITTNGLSASIYTQPTDVENEVNGLFTYDRQVLKVDPARVRAVNLSVIAAATGIQVNQLASLQVSTPGFTNRYLRHAASLARTDVIGAASTAADKQDASWWLRPGLANASCTSFESRNNPGHYLRQLNLRVRKDPRDGSAQFDRDATFCARPALAGNGVSFESLSMTGRYLRHFGEAVYIANASGTNPWDNPNMFAADATWGSVVPWWRSGADLPANQRVSLQVTTAGFTNRYARHANSLGLTEVVTATSPALLKSDATWIVRPGLADSTCYSLESQNFPGHYVRHAEYRIRKDPRDGSALFDLDATFCAQPGLAAGGVSFASYNMPGYHLRHYGAELFVAIPGGPRISDTPGNYAPDVTWNIAAPWVP